MMKLFNYVAFPAQKKRKIQGEMTKWTQSEQLNNIRPAWRLDTKLHGGQNKTVWLSLQQSS